MTRQMHTDKITRAFHIWTKLRVSVRTVHRIFITVVVVCKLVQVKVYTTMIFKHYPCKMTCSPAVYNSSFIDMKYDTSLLRNTLLYLPLGQKCKWDSVPDFLVAGRHTGEWHRIRRENPITLGIHKFIAIMQIYLAFLLACLLHLLFIPFFLSSFFFLSHGSILLLDVFRNGLWLIFHNLIISRKFV